MNEIVNKFLLAWDKFMHEIHLTQPGFMYCACGLFTKNKEAIQKFNPNLGGLFRGQFWGEGVILKQVNLATKDATADLKRNLRKPAR